jgi:hypothetical protein
MSTPTVKHALQNHSPYGQCSFHVMLVTSVTDKVPKISATFENTTLKKASTPAAQTGNHAHQR